MEARSSVGGAWATPAERTNVDRVDLNGDTRSMERRTRPGHTWPAQGDGRWIAHRPRRSVLRFWNLRGTITIADLGPFDMNETIARRLTTHELHYYPHVRTGDRPGHAIVATELRRREAWVPRMALTISAISLIVSVLALALRAGH